MNVKVRVGLKKTHERDKKTSLPLPSLKTRDTKRTEITKKRWQPAKMEEATHLLSIIDRKLTPLRETCPRALRVMRIHGERCRVLAFRHSARKTPVETCVEE